MSVNVWLPTTLSEVVKTTYVYIMYKYTTYVNKEQGLSMGWGHRVEDAPVTQIWIETIIWKKSFQYSP